MAVKANGKQNRQNPHLKDERKRKTKSREINFRVGVDIFSFKPIIVSHLVII